MRSSMSPLKHHRKLRQNPDKGEHVLHGRRRERSSSATDRPYIHSPSFLQGQNVPACSMITKRVMINRTEGALYRNTCPLHVSYRHRLPVWTESFRGRRERGERDWGE